MCMRGCVLFREILKKRLFHGTKKTWMDEVLNDLQAIGICCVRIERGGLICVQ